MNAVVKPIRVRRPRQFISVSVDVDVDVSEVLEGMDDAELRAELEARSRAFNNASALLVYEHFARVGGAPQVLRDYLFDVTGRTLP